MAKIDERVEKLENDFDVLKRLLQKLVAGGGKIDLNLTVEELVVKLQHVGDRVVNLGTTTTPGRVMFCALKDLNREPFRERELRAVLAERAWRTPHSTLAPILADLVRKGLLISDTRMKPYKYRLPSKVTFRGDEI